MLSGVVGHDLVQPGPVGVPTAQLAFHVLLADPLHDRPSTDAPHIDIYEGDIASSSGSKGCVVATLLATPGRIFRSATRQDHGWRTYLWATTLVISSLPVSMMRLILSSMVERTTSAERMSLSLVLRAGRGGSDGGPESKEGVKFPFSPLLNDRSGGAPRAPGVGSRLALSFLPTAFLTRSSTISTVLALTLTALPLTVWAWVKAERVLGLLITSPVWERGGPGEEEREVGSDTEREFPGVRWVVEEEGVWGLEWVM